MSDIDVDKESQRAHLTGMVKTAARCLFASVLVVTIGTVTCAPSCAKENEWKGRAQQCDNDITEFRLAVDK